MTSLPLQYRWILLFLIMPSISYGFGILEFRINSFQNYNGLDADGACCSQALMNDTSAKECSLICNPALYVCLDLPDQHKVSLSKHSPCTLGASLMTTSNQTGHLSVYHNMHRVMVISEVMRREVDYRWPGALMVTINVWHIPAVATTSTDDDGARQVLLRVTERKSLHVGRRWFSEEYSNAHSRLRIQMRFVCAEHYYGQQCETFCSARNDSGGNYVCDKNGNKICMPGWQGAKCKNAICKPGCKHGNCERPGECLCQIGYAGELCDICIPYPGCKNGQCVEPFQCKCNPGWGGIFCNEETQYCGRHAPCQNGGLCNNTGVGSYVCTCPAGFSGTNCELKVETCQAKPCLNGGTCRDSGGNYTCTCAPGFSGRRCQSNARTCKERPCENEAVCVDTSPTGYMCMCQPGWEGANCDTETDHCRADPCLNGGSCVSVFGGFQCVCRVGFNGDRCETNVNDCHENACLNGGTCEDDVNNFRCHCPPGFMGTLCQTNINDCLKHVCHNGGSCIDLVNDFACVCPPGFKGKDCSIEIGHCDSSPCLNGGTCHSVHHDYQCQCTSCYSGRNCHLQSDKCLKEISFQRNVTSAPAVALGGENERRFVDELRSSFSEIPVLIGAPLASVLILIMIILILVLFGLYRKSKYPRSSVSPTIKNNAKLYEQQNHWNEWKLTKNSNAGKICNTGDKTDLTYNTKDVAPKFKGLENDSDDSYFGGKFLDGSTKAAASNRYETFLGPRQHKAINPNEKMVSSDAVDVSSVRCTAAISGSDDPEQFALSIRVCNGQVAPVPPNKPPPPPCLSVDQRRPFTIDLAKAPSSTDTQPCATDHVSLV